MADRPHVITGQMFGKALADVGVLDNFGTIRRVVVDAQADHIVMLYIERYGDERMLQVLQTLDGVEIREMTREAPSSGMTHTALPREDESPATHHSGGVGGAENSGRGSVDSPHHRTPAATERNTP